MSTAVEPKHGTPLYDSLKVLRFARLTSEGPLPMPCHFDLSSADKDSELKSLSVWETTLTPVSVALRLMSGSSDDYGFGLRLCVGEVRSIQFKSQDHDDTPARNLDVIWDHDTRPSAQGHAGIIGLTRPPGMAKSEFKKVKIRLAEISEPFLLGEEDAQHPRERQVSEVCDLGVTDL